MPPRRRLVRRSVRTRILGGYVLLLVLAGATALLLQRRVLQQRLDRDVSVGLSQEVEELRVLVAGRDPKTGLPFGADVTAVFDTFLSRNLPLEGEAFVTYVDGRAYQASGAPYRILEDQALTDRWGRLDAPSRGEVRTQSGIARYLAVPVRTAGPPAATFVAADFIDTERDEIDDTLRVGAAVFGSVLLVATAAAWLVAGRVLAPLRLVRETAEDITGTDLSRRIDVDGGDDIAELAGTFNAMLDRLDEAFASQRAFLDDASHELRTPITVVRGHLELLGDDPVERRDTVALVTDELDRMARIVSELLVLARAERPDFLRLEPLDLDAVVTEVAAKAQALGPPIVVTDVAHAAFSADRHRLTQAIMNLVENAARHTGAGEVVEIGSAATDGHVRIWVADHGPGIPEADRARIFERFVRLDGDARRGGSAGLGLAIVKAIADAHGGRVEVDSAPGGGARFAIVLPVGG